MRITSEQTNVILDGLEAAQGLLKTGRHLGLGFVATEDLLKAIARSKHPFKDVALNKLVPDRRQSIRSGTKKE